jgi:Fe(3+) dicitrate transport protein
VLGVLLGVLAFGAPTAAQAQRTLLQGEVRDAQTGAPVSGARVRVLDTVLQASTDVEGVFRLSLEGARTVTVEASALGYAPARQGVAAGSAARLDFRLEPAPVAIPEIAVVGTSRRALARIPGSAAIVTAQEMEQRVPLSGNEVLRSVPGVHIQEEEGMGMRANIGIRGLDPGRSRTVLVLEDGVPVALNPYGEPEMYYTPPIDRMERVEVVKGSGSILFGPQTIGGVVNYVTPSVPAAPEGSLEVLGGTGGALRAIGSYGGTWDRFGARVGAMHKRADDIRGLFYEITDVTGKLAYDLGGGHRLGAKLSLYDEDSNSTYLGLTEAMFAADADRHPAPDDRLRMRRKATSLTHVVALGSRATLHTTAYGYATSRDWLRQDFGYSADGSEIVFRPSYGNRNRSFEVYGIEPRLQWSHALFGISSELDAGVRAQYERADDAFITGTPESPATGELRDFEVRHGRALAAYVQNRFRLGGGVALTPGVRVESYGFDRNVRRMRVGRTDPLTGETTSRVEDVDIRSADHVFEIIPGLGATWSPSARLTLFAGAHRGFAPPRAKDAFVVEDASLAPGATPANPVSLQLDAERSLNLELGTRAYPLPGLAFEATGFLLDFSNQIIAPSLASGSVAQAALANQGETRHAGVESGLELDFGTLLDWPVSVTAEAKHTYVHAVFSADRFLETAAGDTANVRGNRLPYAPEHLLVLGLGLDDPRGFGVRLDGTLVGAQYADNFETVTATANGRTGRIPGYQVWNLSGSYRLPVAGLTLFGTVKNIFDAQYVASRRPQGIKPGLPRLLNLGVRVAM